MPPVNGVRSVIASRHHGSWPLQVQSSLAARWPRLHRPSQFLQRVRDTLTSDDAQGRGAPGGAPRAKSLLFVVCQLVFQLLQNFQSVT